VGQKGREPLNGNLIGDEGTTEARLVGKNLRRKGRGLFRWDQPMLGGIGTKS